MSETDQPMRDRPPIPTAQPWSGLVPVLLLVSLAINLLVAGFALGAWLNGAPATPAAQTALTTAQEGDGLAATASMQPWRMFRLLPPETRRRVGRQMVGRAAEPRRLMAEARIARQASVEALTAEPFDQERLSAAFARSRAADQAFLESVHAVVDDMIALLTPDERAQLAVAIRERMARRQEAREPLR